MTVDCVDTYSGRWGWFSVGGLAIAVQAGKLSYGMGSSGNNGCTVGQITDSSSCEAAASELQYDFSLSGNWPYSPKGCFHHDAGLVYFNTHTTGAAKAHYTPICQADHGILQQNYQALALAKKEFATGTDVGVIMDTATGQFARSASEATVSVQTEATTDANMNSQVPVAALGSSTSADIQTVPMFSPSVLGKYALDESYVGDDFFSRWSFFEERDPTHGAVKYADAMDASRLGLVSATADEVYMGVDMLSSIASSGRSSVRIHSKTVYNAGLFVVSLEHIPTGCGTWPALWMFGEDAEHLWPTWGEYDIIEGVHNADRTMTSLHTAASCDQSQLVPGLDFASEWKRGAKKLADNCDIHAPGQWNNQGCSQNGPAASMGNSFHSGGGGTYAFDWDPEAGHLRAWFWQAGYEPLDVLQKHPEPDGWGKPYSYFRLAPETCSTQHFRNMRLVFDLSLCGDLAGPTFEESCPEAAKVMTCRQFVEEHPENLTEAYWKIRTLDVYQRSRAQEPVPLVEILRRKFDANHDRQVDKLEHTRHQLSSFSPFENIAIMLFIAVVGSFFISTRAVSRSRMTPRSVSVQSCVYEQIPVKLKDGLSSACIDEMEIP